MVLNFSQKAGVPDAALVRQMSFYSPNEQAIIESFGLKKPFRLPSPIINTTKSSINRIPKSCIYMSFKYLHGR